MDEDFYSCASFDPGGTTGWAVMSVYREAIEDPEYKILENVAHWSAGEFVGPWESQVDQMIELVLSWPSAKVVCEDFYLRQMAVDLSPVKVTSAFEYEMRRISRKYKGGPVRPVIKQMPALAMAITDDRLRAWGYYASLTGQPHARDALKHNLTWLRRAKEILGAHRVT
jgi:hypothetical protein